MGYQCVCQCVCECVCVCVCVCRCVCVQPDWVCMCAQCAREVLSGVCEYTQSGCTHTLHSILPWHTEHTYTPSLAVLTHSTQYFPGTLSTHTHPVWLYSHTPLNTSLAH